MIKYRPHRGSLYDSMNAMKTFNTLNDMLNYIFDDYNGFISPEDIVIGENDVDDRIDWKENRYVYTKRIGNNNYNIPQCIGMCSFE